MSPRIPSVGKWNFWKYLRSISLTPSLEERSLSSVETMTVFGVVGGALGLLDFLDDKRLVDRNTSALGLTPMLSEGKRGSSRQI